MQTFVPEFSSSSVTSTKPAVLNRREDGTRRKSQRSSSWSAWVPPPLLRHPSDKVSPTRSSSLGRQTNPNIVSSSEQKEPEEKRGSFRKWRKRKDKKSVTFEDDIGVDLDEDLGSASGTVRRQKVSKRGPVSGIFPQQAQNEEHKCDPDSVSRFDFANRPAPPPGSWNEPPTPGQEAANREYWSSLRRRLEENAQYREEQHVTKSGRKEQGNSSHQRTVSRDDQLTARGANPRTGVVSPSIMSVGSHSSSHDSQEDNATPKWRLKGNGWISLDPNEKTPFPSPPANEIAQPKFPNLQGHKVEPPALHSPLRKSNIHPTKFEDKVGVNTTSSKEPSSLEMTTQQIVDFQKAIERVHREGGQMLDPDTIPTPRSVTPTGLSTPPRRLSRNIREKLLGRKRGAASFPPASFSKRRLEQDKDNDIARESNHLDSNIKVTLSNDLLGPAVLGPRNKFSESEVVNNEVQAISSPRHTHGLNQDPFLDQGGVLGQDRSQVSWFQTEICPHCPSSPWMIAYEFPVKKFRAYQVTPPNLSTDEGGITGKAPPAYTLTKAEILHGRQLLGALLRKVWKHTTKEDMLTRDQEISEFLSCSTHLKLPEQGKQSSTIITTMIPTSTTTSTTSTNSPLAIGPLPLSPGATHEKLCPIHSGICWNQQQSPLLSEALRKGTSALNGSAEEEDINNVPRNIPLNLARNMHGSIPISEALSDPHSVQLIRDCGFHDQRGRLNTGMRTDDPNIPPISTSLVLSPIHLNGTWPRDRTSRFQNGEISSKMMEQGFENIRILSNRCSQSDAGEIAPPETKTGYNESVFCNQFEPTLDAVASTFHFLYYVVSDHHTINFIRLTAVQFLNMALHCLKTTMRVCNCFHEFSKTGVFPEIPQSVDDIGVLIIDFGRAFVYFAIMVVVFTILARGLGLLATVASWLAWPIRVWGLL
ncbi:uncharacterized protein PADG_03173 [Paracoccidioides brasiliensis Pb18]|uniref:Uncharacterized protein n=1 Tax=Paracoccidioides brasiliensis (strain Pb18) TaxID=502780 RepID=C1G7L8_PARBD|nr:uncharacterized protein PADG_03173 [Paracoccidioides brasiliensis Pb18]EEH47075.2 hypothetical protein PADG_03173 [Paracoccidioides brasiliensis Pb18]